jgi:RNase P/RNase MRP subunit p29
MKEQVTLSGTIKRETDKAIQFMNSKGTVVWLPKSQCEFDVDTGTVILPKWLADTKEINE